MTTNYIKLNELVGKIKQAYLNAQTNSTKAVLEDILPELAESEDERIRNEIVRFIQMEVEDEIVGNKWIAWLKKQESVGEIVERCKTSWYNEGKIQGQIEGLSDEEKYQQGWHDALEKQGEQKPIINVPSREVILAIWDLGNEWKELTNGSISTEYGTQLYYIQKHWHESEYYLQKKQGEQKSAEWHKGDEQNLNACLGYISDECLRRWLMDVIHVKYDKPTNKVETKFNVGDWLQYRNAKPFFVEKITKQGYVNGISCLPFNWENEIHLWTIKDAKDGDVLYSQKHNLIWIYKDNKHYYASINLNYVDSISFDGDIFIPSDVCPATKEQRDTLFAKMKEAGYMWDAEKKELKKIEDENYDGEDYGIDSLFHAQRILEKTLGKVDGYQTDDGILSHKCAITAVNKLYKQKSAWSEEDECYMSECIGAIATKDGWSFEEKRKTKHWLESLKDRYAWKPSNEQMKALHHLNLTGNISYAGQGQTLIELYNDLKKLREE